MLPLIHNALEQLADRLTTPLQIEQHLRLAFEEAYLIGQKPVEAEIIDSILTMDINAMDSVLTRHGYNVKILADLLDTKPTEIRSFFKRQPSTSENAGNTKQSISDRYSSLILYLQLMWVLTDVFSLFATNVV